MTVSERLNQIVRWVGIAVLSGGISIFYLKPDEPYWPIVILALGGLTTLVSFFPRNIFEKMSTKMAPPVAKEDIDPEKYEEAAQLAELLVLNINILYYLSKKPNMTVEELQNQITHLYEDKEEVIKDATVRRNRYASASSLFAK